MKPISILSDAAGPWRGRDPADLSLFSLCYLQRYLPLTVYDTALVGDELERRKDRRGVRLPNGAARKVSRFAVSNTGGRKCPA